MEGIISGIVSGIISGIIVSEIYRRIENNREIGLNFRDDQQIFAKSLAVIKNELELYDKTGSSEQLIRAINEPRLFYSFTEKNLSQKSLEVITDANMLLRELEKSLRGSERLMKQEISRYSSALTMSQLNILMMRLKRKEAKITRSVKRA